MPAAIALVIADAQATPVNHTFAPSGRDEKGTFWWVDRSQANAIGFWKVSCEFKEPASAQAGTNSKERTYRIRIGLHEPVLETLSNSTVTGISPAPTVAYVPRSFVEYVVPERATLVDRQNLRKMIGLLQSGTFFSGVVDDLDRVY